MNKLPGFIVWPNASATDGIDLSLRFKTTNPDGSILLVSTRDHSDPFSVALVDGNLVSYLVFKKQFWRLKSIVIATTVFFNTI